MENFHEWNWQRDKEFSERAASLAAEWRGRLVGWLAVGNFGALGLLATFATRFKDPVAVLTVLRPALWAFLIGGVLAGVGGWTIIERSNARANATRRRARKNYALYLANKKQRPPKPTASVDAEIASLQKKAESMHRILTGSIALSAILLLIGFATPLVVITFVPGWFPAAVD